MRNRERKRGQDNTRFTREIVYHTQLVKSKTSGFFLFLVFGRASVRKGSQQPGSQREQSSEVCYGSLSANRGCRWVMKRTPFKTSSPSVLFQAFMHKHLTETPQLTVRHKHLADMQRTSTDLIRRASQRTPCYRQSVPRCHPPGGAAHSFEVQGYHFDAGPSFFLGLTGPKGASINPLKQVLAHACRWGCAGTHRWVRAGTGRCLSRVRLSPFGGRASAPPPRARCCGTMKPACCRRHIWSVGGRTLSPGSGCACS